MASACQSARAGSTGPLVVVALPVFEPQVDLLAGLLESIKGQDHECWVCVISDDGSAADRLAAIRSLVSNDPRFVLLTRTERVGAGANLERTLASIGESGDLIAPADQSDRWHPAKLSSLIRTLGDGGQLAYSDVRVLGPSGRTLAESLCNAPGQLSIESLCEGDELVPGSATLLRGEVLRRALPFPEQPGLRHDQWLAIAALAGGEVRYTNATLTVHTALQPGRAFELATAAGGRSRSIRSLAGLGRNGDPVSSAEVESTIRSRLNGTSPPVPEVSELAISVQGLTKSFAIAGEEPETLAGRLRHPFLRVRRKRFTALEDVSFEVARGEFFGIVGANGSGKTTLLQLLANIYEPDRGKVLIAPRVAPIISLGIGFQQDLPALPNVLLTAELLGVPPAEARARFDGIIEFAGLEEFTNLKLRHYSTGMRVRLAFAVVMLVDADVLLFDEVLAVGDSGFKAKATNAFEQLRSDKTVVLVTHNLSHLQTHCDRAMLLNRGRVELVGEVAEVSRRYAELSLEQGGGDDLPLGLTGAPSAKPRAEIEGLWLTDMAGARATSVPVGERLVMHAAVRVDERIRKPGLRFEIRRPGGARVFAPPTGSIAEGPRGIEPGKQVEVETVIENKLTPGPYLAVCAVTASREDGERAVSEARSLEFAVAPGADELQGFVALDHSVSVHAVSRGSEGSDSA